MKPTDFTAKSTVAEEDGRYRFTYLTMNLLDGYGT